MTVASVVAATDVAFRDFAHLRAWMSDRFGGPLQPAPAVEVAR